MAMETSAIRRAPAAVVIVVVVVVVVVVVGQASALQATVCEAAPEHPLPPCAAFGDFLRLCFWLPPPHVLEQTPSFENGVHRQLTAGGGPQFFRVKAVEMVIASNSSRATSSASSSSSKAWVVFFASGLAGAEASLSCGGLSGAGLEVFAW